MLTQQSIGKLFMAGIIPGILQALLYIGIIYLLCRRNPLLGPPGRSTTFKEKIASIKLVWPIVVLFVLVMGGIYLGIFSPTEAAAIGAFGAFLLALLRRQLTRSKFISSLLETGKSTAALLLILLGVAVFSSFLSITRLPFELASTITTFDAPPYVILAAILVLYLVLGFFILPMPMIILTVPLLAPIVHALGFDLVWFGILIVITVETGQITPPVAMNIFVIQALDKNIPIGDIYRGIWPFIYSNLAFLIVIVAIPSIALFLPHVMR
jgi:C4-dicarboxylate transporter, DctM subunit